MSQLPERWPARALLALIIMVSLLYGCATPAAGLSINEEHPSKTITTPVIDPTISATTVYPPAPIPTKAAPIKSASPVLWVSSDLTKAFRDQLTLPRGIKRTDERAAANLWIEAVKSGARQPGGGDKSSALIAKSSWIYALVTPFPTLIDEVSWSVIQKAWAGTPGADFEGKPILLTAGTRTMLESAWGPASPKGVRVITGTDLLDTAWKDQPAWAIIPFEEIQPRWKVLRVDKQSPVEKGFDASGYPLAISIELTGQTEALKSGFTGFALPTNRDPNKLTVLVMTGTTAISRHIGERMEEKGLTYPAQDIGTWLSSADLTHISNEVSFYKDCPKPGPDRADMRFCSNPKYIQLLEAVGTDIVELTGNHNLDWGPQPFLDSLQMYRQRGWKTYGGGANLTEAVKPLLVVDHGNKLAFIGCSPAGPESVWATNNQPGSAPCNYAKLKEQIAKVSADGYLPIVTFQAVETDTNLPAVAQGMPNFRDAARAGAVIVSGSQSHIAQTMTFVNNHFVHYGLGNLFFDQMKPPENRPEFIDQHVFYNGKYLGVNLLTALLEDYARPRPMTQDERSEFLQKIFSLSDWSGN